MLDRLDERTQQMGRDITDIKNALAISYVTQKEFAPIRSAVFAVIGIVGSSFLLAVVGLVIKLTR